ncbi:MAG TPA: LysR family transcriptional regulator, partial [Methylobacterium sp.]
MDSVRNQPGGTSATDDGAAWIELRLGGTIAVGSARIAVADAHAFLQGIERMGSVQGVASELGLSYRAAWERLRALETGLGRRLVQKTRGHGSALTAEGEALYAALARASAGLAPSLARETRAMQACLADILGKGAVR